MATIHEKYDFFLNVPGVGSRQVYPEMDKLLWRWEKTAGGFKRLTVGNDFTFFDDVKNDIEDFTLLYPLERERRRCDRIRLTINIKCEGSSTFFWEGFFYVSDGKPWDVSACSVTIKPAPNDPYQCIEDHWEEQLNLLEFGTPVEIRDTYGEIQYITCEETKYSNDRISPRDPLNFDYFRSTECLDVPNSWTLANNSVVTTNEGTVEVPRGSGFSTQINLRIDITSEYVREFTADPSPPGAGWISVPGGFARPIEVALIFDPDTGEYSSEVLRLGTIPNALLFSEVLTNVFDKFCPDYSFISNYFSINIDGTAPANKHYIQAAADYLEQYFIPKSELLFYGASDRATATPEVTLKKLLNDLKVFYSVQIGVKDDKIYLEHESYFKGDAHLDLRHENFEFYMKGNFKYDYVNQQLPTSEKWFAADLTDVIGDFDLARVEYEPCASVSAPEKPYKAEVITTNIAAIVKSGRNDDGNVSPNGVALVAASQKVILFSTGVVSGKAIVNGVLSFPYVIENNHSYRRPLTRGRFNEGFLSFTKPWPARSWKGTFCLNCTDLQAFNPDGLVNTVLPWGEIEKAEFEEPGGIMKLETHHD